jgi:hypothetical protein
MTAGPHVILVVDPRHHDLASAHRRHHLRPAATTCARDRRRRLTSHPGRRPMDGQKTQTTVAATCRNHVHPAGTFHKSVRVL